MAKVTPLPIAPPPGVVLTESVESVMVRWTLPWQFWVFRNGKPQKMGGWIQAAAALTSGTPRATLGWSDFFLNNYIAVGTYRKLYVYDTVFVQNDITPFRLTSSGIGGGSALTNPFTTTNGSSIVKVTQTTHGVQPGDTVIFTSVASGIGGLTPANLTGSFLCTDVIDLNDYNFDCGVIATVGNDSFTKALLHMDGTDGSTTFTDSNVGGAAHTWTANGDAQIDTADSVFGGGSGLFDGAGDFVSTPDHADFTLGSADWTIEIRFKCNAAGGTFRQLAGQSDTADQPATSAWLIRRDDTNVIRAMVSNGSTMVAVASTTQFTNAVNPGFHDLMLVRTGNTLKLFLDGIQEGGDVAFTGSVQDSAVILAVGRAGVHTGIDWSGWLDEFRLDVGTARKTANFTPATQAYSTAGPGGGTVQYNYEISVGSELGAGGYGWGVGPYGQGTWGTARAQTTVFFEARIWGLDNFGKILLASPCPQAALYEFDPTQNQPWPRATKVANAPTDIRHICVTPEQFVFACRESMVFGSSSQGDYNTWTPATNNTAFQRTLTVGKKLVASRVLNPGTTLTWTDAALYKNEYTGTQFVYDTNMEGRDCGLLSPSAAVTIAGAAYWMGADNFWMYSGGSVQPMPNVEDVRKYIFDRLDQQNGFGCAVAYNPTQDSIWFMIVQRSVFNPSILLIFHRHEQVWTPHPLTRCSGFHFTSGDTRPYFWDSDGTLYQHENGLDANGQPIITIATLAPYSLGGLEQGSMSRMDIEGIRCDTKEQIGNLSWTLTTFDQIADTIANSTIEDTETVVTGPPGGTLEDFRLGGRFASLQISGSDLGGYARIGTPIVYVKPSGMRRG